MEILVSLVLMVKLNVAQAVRGYATFTKFWWNNIDQILFPLSIAIIQFYPPAVHVKEEMEGFYANIQEKN